MTSENTSRTIDASFISLFYTESSVEITVERPAPCKKYEPLTDEENDSIAF